MTNQKIAELLTQFADLLDIKGESSFRVSAYRRAADTIKRSERLIADDVRAGSVTEIKGIGKGIAANLAEIVIEGHFSELDHLQDEVPATLLTILEIPGIGPKTVGRLYRELSITNLDQLDQTTRDGIVRTLKGFGKSQERKILDGIAFLRQRTGRISIGTAMPLARKLAHDIRDATGARVEIAGSVRRYAETVGDINLVIESDDIARTAEAIRHALGDGAHVTIDDSRITATQGIPPSIRVVPSSTTEFIQIWHRATGSDSHLEALQKITRDTDADVTEESEIYTSRELEWIPPELREDRGEIEAARENRLPDLVSHGHIRGDLHLHSDWSDGRATIGELAERAAELGYEYLAIADHSHSLAIANGLTAERLLEQAEMIAKFNDDGAPVRLLRASEVEIRRDGSLDFPDHVLSELDIVVASLHSSRSMSRNELTERLLQAIEHPHVDIIGHPTGRIIERRPPAEYDWERIFDAASRTQTALEINANPARLDLPEELAREAVERGVLIAIDSDAHDLQGLEVMEYGVGIARRGWVPRTRVVNTWSYATLEAWLRR
jgi:DNA polymerase (family X)